jgi:hypothetical protein
MDDTTSLAAVESVVERLCRHLLFWARTDDEFGYLLVGMHVFVVWFFMFMIAFVLSITSPSIYIIGTLIVSVVLFAQHYLLGCCVLSNIEKRMNGDCSPVLEPLLSLICIQSDPINLRNYICLALALIIILLLAQLIRRWR